MIHTTEAVLDSTGWARQKAWPIHTLVCSYGFRVSLFQSIIHCSLIGAFITSYVNKASTRSQVIIVCCLQIVTSTVLLIDFMTNIPNRSGANSLVHKDKTLWVWSMQLAPQRQLSLYTHMKEPVINIVTLVQCANNGLAEKVTCNLEAFRIFYGNFET